MRTRLGINIPSMTWLYVLIDFHPMPFVISPKFYSDQIPSEDAHHVENRREQRNGDKGGDEIRSYEIPIRIQAHQLQSINLLADSHDSDLCSNGGSRPARHHERGDDRPHFLDEREPDHGAEKGVRSKTAERVEPLVPEHHSRERAGQKDNKQGLVPDKLDLLENKRNLNWRRRAARDSLPKKDAHASHLQDLTHRHASDFLNELQARFP